jgi:general secretion pathway protein A
MSYYELLDLHAEPFSTSPDPTFFYRSTSHRQALNRLEIAIRLRRGLSLMLGDVGTGKTTLTRMLASSLAHEDGINLHMVLDPTYDSEFQFLAALTRMFGIQPAFKSTLDYREAIERYLFQQGVEEGKVVTLLIDEGQKLTPSLLEELRILLNYETNDYKLLQVVIFGQLELLPRVNRIRNFMDRVVMKYLLNPLDELEMAAMIQFRLQQAGLPSGRRLFTPGAIHMIHQATQGYPRKVAFLCHSALTSLVMHEQSVVDADLIDGLIREEVEWSDRASAIA